MTAPDEPGPSPVPEPDGGEAPRPVTRRVRDISASSSIVGATPVKRSPLRRTLSLGKRVVRKGLRVGEGLTAVVLGRAAAATAPRKRLRATAEEEVALRARLAETLVPCARTTGPLVTIIVPTHNGVVHLRRLLPALDAVAYDALEIVVIDNASGAETQAYLRSAPTRRPLIVVRNEVNATFSAANNAGAHAGSGELLLLLNDDIEPAGPHVIGHMVERLLGDPALAAVGARLIYPRRAGRKMGPIERPSDLSLQHRGTAFRMQDGALIARNLGAGEDPLGPLASESREVPAATAAALLVRRSAFEAVDGFADGYDYGAEDVDLCARLRATGGRIWYEPQATFWHHESATQRVEDMEARKRRHEGNWRHFHDLWGPSLYREVFLDRLAVARRWSETGLHVGITVTREDPAAGWGDWYTAHELGDALEGLGWRVSYLERFENHWYSPDPTIDVIVSLIDALDVRRLPPGIVTVAWIRNWTDRWLSRPWFDEHDIILASSTRSKELIEERSAHVALLMPIATNPARFVPRDPAATPRYDAITTGNRWGEVRGVEDVLPALAATGRTVAAFGRGWETVPSMAPHAGGALPYDELPAVYASAAILVDDTATPTKPYGAVNSRVFDALATGTLVVTDNVLGARELFGDDLPAAGDAVEQAALVERWLADPEGRAVLAARLQATVLERHTYARRATELRDLLEAWVRSPRVELAIAAPDWTTAEGWGDYHFGRALQGAIQRRGLPTRLRLRSAWEAPGSERADVAIGIFGLAPLRSRAAQVSVSWIISHPDKVTDEMLAGNDLVFVASDVFAAELEARGHRVTRLHQATDTHRFRPTPGGPAHDLLFVANSRGVRRPAVEELAGKGFDLALYGRGWTAAHGLPKGVLRGEHVPNVELPAYYSAAGIVLNDTWPDMSDLGFISNRLYDAAACGALVISDDVLGIEQEFDGAVLVFHDGAELRDLATRYLADPAARAALGMRAMEIVRARHTFDQRAATILEQVAPRLHAHAGLVMPPDHAAG